jgi:SAM-dependent methyltransferase
VTFFARPLDAGSLPPLDLPPDVEVRAIAASELHRLRTGGDPTQKLDELERRYRRGDQAYAALAGDGQAAHLRWVTSSRAHIPELGRDIALAPHQAYFYNGYTRPDMRGRGFDGFVRTSIFQALHAAGKSEVFSYVRRSNPAGLRAAARWQQPVGTLWYLRIRPFPPIVIGSRSRLPALITARAAADQQAREARWTRWFEGWLREPLAKRSLGCAAISEADFQSSAAFLDRTLAFDPSSDDVLDLGCDSAMISRLIAPRCRRFLGVDFIPDMLQDARRQQVRAAGRPAWFAAGDGCRLPIRSHTFTKAYCSAVIHTLPSRAHGMAVVEELLRVTAPGGRVLLSSVPDRAKRVKTRAGLWARASWGGKLTLPVRWILPGSLKHAARRILRRPSDELPAFLDYDLRAIGRSLERRGFRYEILDFPADYWSGDFRTSRSNLLIHVPVIGRP